MTATMNRITRLLILLVLAALVLPDTADAQLLKRLKDRAKERVEKRVEDKADEAVDKAVDKAADNVEDAAMSAFERRTTPEALNLGENADGPADAPYVRYRSTTSMDLGAMGKMARLFGKELEHQTETVSFSGQRQRTDDENQSTIIDLESNSMIMLDHKNRQYSMWTFSDMAERLDEAMTQMQGQAGQEQPAPNREDLETEISFDMSVDRTGRKESINGSPSEQLLLKLRADFDIQAKDESGEEAHVRGTTYALIDTWTSREIAGFETIQGFQRSMGEKMGASFAEGDVGSSLEAMGMGPQLGMLMQEASKELQELDGFVVRSTTHLVLVPEGEELDVEAALRPSSGDAAGSANALAAMAAGMEDGENAAPAQQVTLMRITTQVSDLQVDALPDDHFAIPPDYKKVDLF